jgi:hypothetical protein
LTQGIPEKSELSQHLYEEEKVVQIDPNTTYRRCKESAHPISEAGLDIPRTWTPIVEEDVPFLCWFYTGVSFMCWFICS